MRTALLETVNTEPVTLESVLAKENLNAAWSPVKAHDEAAGVDGMDGERSLTRRCYPDLSHMLLTREVG
jgi:hypothetical protein